MRLFTITTLWYTIISALVFAGAGMAFFLAIEDLMREEADEQLHNEKLVILDQLRKGEAPEPACVSMDKRIHIIPLPAGQKVKEEYSDTTMQFRYADGDEEVLPFRRLIAGVDAGGNAYKLDISISMLESDDLGERILKLVLTLFGVTLLLILGLNVLLSRLLWKPFRSMLTQMQQYKVEQHQALEIPASSIAEFRELGAALKHLTDRVHASFDSLKEFTENASHEIQTPLAILQSKAESLMQAEDLAIHHADDLAGMARAVQRLSRLNQALLLLSKIENRQFPDQTLIRPAALIQSILDNFSEWMDEKHLQLETELDADVSLSMNPVLADILLSNLIGNAIRHSKEQGIIRIRLTSRELQLENTGGPPVADGEKLFGRFHKADPSSRSLGLGLSIVRKICDVQGYTIRYEGRMPDVHRFVLGF